MTSSSPGKPQVNKQESARTPVVVSFVSRSGAGKTTFLEKLVPALKKQGLSVGILKHHAHPTSFDVPGKDTYRLSEAGADIVVGASPVQTAIFIPGDASSNPDAVIQRHLMDVDLVLVEGYRRAKYRKIEVYRAHRQGEEGEEQGLLCNSDELLAVVTDIRLKLPDTVPQFRLEDTAGVATLLADLMPAGRDIV